MSVQVDSHRHQCRRRSAEENTVGTADPTVCRDDLMVPGKRVVSLDHGCGAHSETDMDHPEPPSVGEPIVDEFAVDLEPTERAPEGEGQGPTEEQHGSDDPVTD